jgi:polyisoprenoid-binding protein YceI
MAYVNPTLRSLFLALLVASEPVALLGQEFQVDLGAEKIVRFTSRAAIEEFEGVTDRIDGFLVLTTPRLESGLGGDDTEFYFEVDLGSLDTGIKLRNRHMRDNYLEVRKYPYATLEGRLGSVQEDPEGGFRVAIVGIMGIHGVSKRVSIPCGVSEEGSGYRARCAWELLLSDYEIEIPRIMFLKLADNIRIELDFALVPASSYEPREGTGYASTGETK